MKRRAFIRLGGAALGAPLLVQELEALAPRLQGWASVSAEALAQDEDYWAEIRRAFALSPQFLNLNNGNCSSHPRAAAAAFEAYYRQANEAPALHLWREQYPRRNAIRQRLAALAGCPPSEIALQRNATEALHTVLHGIDLPAGAEILCSDQEYPCVEHSLKQRNRREGLRIVPAPCIEHPGQEARAFAQALSAKTALIVCPHITHLSGRIMPVAEIGAMARQRDIPFLIDGAHSFAQLDFRIPELNCDFFAASLHKWLCGPLGTGLLYVKSSRIPALWPLHPAPDGEENAMSKFEHSGTRPFALELALGPALDLHEAIGGARKQARLQYLKNYSVKGLEKLPEIEILTDPDPARSCALFVFRAKGTENQELSRRLMADYGIITTVIEHATVSGLRISPHIYTPLSELDRFLYAVKEILKA